MTAQWVFFKNTRWIYFTILQLIISWIKPVPLQITVLVMGYKCSLLHHNTILLVSNRSLLLCLQSFTSLGTWLSLAGSTLLSSAVLHCHPDLSHSFQSIQDCSRTDCWAHTRVGCSAQPEAAGCGGTWSNHVTLWPIIMTICTPVNNSSYLVAHCNHFMHYLYTAQE
jgi:hypothetical protein